MFGIGGGGSHAISRMLALGPLAGVEFVAVNTDAQDLTPIRAHRKLHIGSGLTGGLGAGMDPELGRAAAEESRELIERSLAGADFAILVAGFGGGTGTGALPVVGEMARRLDVLTLAIVTKPFSFEGAERRRIAEEGIAKLRSSVDAFLVIPNDRVTLFLDTTKGLEATFASVDEILRSYLSALYELISLPGFINVDFADLKSVIKNAGPTFIGLGRASGEGALHKAAEQSLYPPLLEFSVKGATQVLFEVAGGRDLSLEEVRKAVETVSEGIHGDARILFGARHDPNMRKDEVRALLLASGFLQAGILFVAPHEEREREAPRAQEPALAPNPVLAEEREDRERTSSTPRPGERAAKTTGEEGNGSFFDIPAFLRRKKKS